MLLQKWSRGLAGSKGALSLQMFVSFLGSVGPHPEAPSPQPLGSGMGWSSLGGVSVGVSHPGRRAGTGSSLRLWPPGPCLCPSGLPLTFQPSLCPHPVPSVLSLVLHNIGQATAS